MNLKTIFAGLIAIGLVFASIDFLLNDYMRFFNGEVKTVGVVTIEGATKAPKSMISDSFIEKLPAGVVAEKTSNTLTLFSRLDVSTLRLNEAMQTVLIKDSGKFGTIYEFSGGVAVYMQLKTALNLILETGDSEGENDSIIEVDNLGDYSLYYNDRKRENTVFLLALANGRIWGFEYPREYHEEYKILTKALVD